MHSPSFVVCLLVVALPAAAQTARAQERSAALPTHYFLQLGYHRHTQTVTNGVHWFLGDVPGLPAGRWSLLAEASFGAWSSQQQGPSGRAYSIQLGVAPKLRYRFERWPGLFAEAGIGVNAIAPKYRSVDKYFSTVFNFGDHVGIGHRSADGAYEWVLRYQHFSNGGFHKPNPGENFVQLLVAAAL
jgi:hypothetical protein